MGAAPVAIAALSVGSAVGGAVEQYEGEQSEEKALNTELDENTLRTQQKTLSNYDLLSKTLKMQEAQMTVRGVASGSPSFNAIQRNTENIASRNQNNINLEGDLIHENIRTEQSNVRDKLYSDLFEDTTNIGMALAGAKSKMPVMPE